MMSLYVDLSIHKIEIVKPKRDLKPVLELQKKVDRTLPRMSITVQQNLMK